MNHSARDSLDAFIIKVKNIEGTNTPTMIIAVLPIIHTVFPPAFVTSPPFASNIAVLQPPFRNTKGIGITTLIIDVLGSETKVKRGTQSDTTYNQGALGIMKGCATLGSEIDAIASIISTSDIPNAAIPTL